MGKRSRKRGGAAPGSASGVTSRVERDALRAAAASAPSRRSRRRSSADERPPAPWGSFPLVELLVLLALGLLLGGFFAGRGAMIVAGLGIGSVAGLELSIREHFAGFRSHTTLLAGAPTLVAIAVTFFATRHGGPRLLFVPVAALVFVTAFWLLRGAFMRRSGGVGFRR